MTKNLEWINVLKGLGIMMVVYGHMTPGFWRDVIFLFHMPLFFFVAGYLLRPRSDLIGYLKRKSLHLLVPYATFMALLYAPVLYKAMGDQQVFTNALKDMVLGGRALEGALSAFWFVTCFWAAQQGVNLLLARMSTTGVRLAMLSMLGLATINQYLFRDIWLAGNLNVVLMAAPCIYLGYWLAQRDVRPDAPCVLLPAIIVTALAMTLVHGELHFTMDMKYADYGLPILSLMAALAITIVLMAISRQLVKVPMLSRGIGLMGEASMVIMFLHLSVQVTLDQHGLVEDLAPRWLLMTALPLLFYLLVRRNGWTRLLFLGDSGVLKARRQHREQQRRYSQYLQMSDIY